ncbi:hypothetical protein VUR80DRAFT_7709 [Thermomyces stellatus]
MYRRHHIPTKQLQAASLINHLAATHCIAQTLQFSSSNPLHHRILTAVEYPCFSCSRSSFPLVQLLIHIWLCSAIRDCSCATCCTTEPALHVLVNSLFSAEYKRDGTESSQRPAFLPAGPRAKRHNPILMTRGTRCPAISLYSILNDVPHTI